MPIGNIKNRTTIDGQLVSLVAASPALSQLTEKQTSFEMKRDNERSM